MWKPYKFSANLSFTVLADNQPSAKSSASDYLRSLTANRLKLATISPVGKSASVSLDSAHYSESASHAQLEDQEIRIIGIIDIKNSAYTMAYADSSDSRIADLFEFLLVNAEESDQAHLPDYFRRRLQPFSSLIWRIVNEAEKLEERDATKTFTYADCYAKAMAELRQTDFNIFVKVETPVRRYYPDGDYDASWGHTRAIYGHGRTYDAAVYQAYRMIKRMRNGKLL